MNANAVGWFEIYVQDMERARTFYESVFQLKLERLEDTEFEMWSFPMNMEAAGTSGALIKINGVPSGGNSTLVYFNCDDCGVQEARVKEAGGRIDRPKTSIGKHGFISLVFDPDGNLFGLHSMR